MKVDLTLFSGAQSTAQAESVLESWIEKSVENNDPIEIGELLLDSESGGALLSRLRRDRSAKYRIKVIRDKWGKSVAPGDKVYRETNKSLYNSPDKPISSRDLSKIVRSKQWEKRMVDRTEFVVDDKGCIMVSADDCFYFLSHFGIHRSGSILSFHPNETSSGPVRMDNENQGMKHVWYWRYMEVTEEEYSELPRISEQTSTNSTVKRGRGNQ